MSKSDLMKEIRDEIFNLTTSPLYKERIENKMFPVIGSGNHDADIILVGEAPGKNEAKTGMPFCGASGKILDILLDDVKLDRKDIYITNVVKDRPTNNRDPKPEEIELYAPFLDRQVDIIKPKVIGALGRFSSSYLMNRYNLGESVDLISNIHGKIFKTKTEFGEFSIVPLYHPAVAVYNRNQLDDLKKDFHSLLKAL